MGGKKRQSPDTELRSRTRFGEPQRIRLYVYENYAIIHKVMLSKSVAFQRYAVRSRKFAFSGGTIYYFRMSLVVAKEEFLTLKRMLALMDPLTDLSKLWFSLENPNKEDESLNIQR